MSLLLGILGGLGIFGLVPLVLTVAAIVDIVRRGAPWYWILVVLMFPVVGSLAYFLLMYGPASIGGMGRLSPDSARRQQAQRRLKELAVQLNHWRGPALLVEAGEELLVLGKTAEAERHLREALTAGAATADVAYPLSQALAVQGRYAEAVPLLEPLVRDKPDARFGAVQLHLARCYDEAGQAAEAERELRDLLQRRNFYEAQVRLARLLLRRGATDEARPLLAELKTTAAQLPGFVRRQQRPWIAAARRLKKGDEPLPKPLVEGAVKPGQRLRLVLVAAGVVLLLGGLVAAWFMSSGLLGYGRLADLARRKGDLRAQIAALDRELGSASTPTGELDDAAIARYLKLRRRLDPAARELAARAERAAAAEASEDEEEGVIATSSLHEHERRSAAENDLLSATVAALRQERMSPAEFDDLLATVEWRCLKRPQARLLAIPPHFRAEWQSAKDMLAAQVEQEEFLAEREERQANAPPPARADEPEAALPGLRQAAADATPADAAPSDDERLEAAVDHWAQQMARSRADAEARIRDIERLADATPPLSAASQQVCEAHRAELQAPAAEAVVPLACVLDATLACR